MEPSYGSGAAIPEGSDSGRQRESGMGSAADVQNPSQQNVDVGDGIETHGVNTELTAARSQEQEAAAILEAANGLEPEYEFQSVEGGEGVLQGQAGDEGTLDGLGSFRQEPVFDQRGDVRQPVVDTQTGGLLNGVIRGGRNAQLLDVVAQGGFDHAAGQSQGPLDWDRGSSGDGRLDVLESLVQQLFQQNEYLKQELSDQASRSSSESARRDRLARVQSRVGGVVEGRGSKDVWESGSKSGKGVGGTMVTGDISYRTFQPPWTSFAPSSDAEMPGMPQQGPGDRILAATRAMQTMSLQDYGFEEHAVGRELANAQLMHQRTGVSPIGERPGGKQLGVSPAETWPPGRQSGVSLKTEGEGGARPSQLAGISLIDADPSSSRPSQLSGISPSDAVLNGNRSVQRPSAFPKEGTLQAQSVGIPPLKALTEGQEVRGSSGAGGVPAGPCGEQAGSRSIAGTVVKVVINGCVREGIYNDRGEIVLVAERPKFYALQDDSSEQYLTPDPPPPPPPRNDVRVGAKSPEARAKGSSTNPFSVQASSPFRSTPAVVHGTATSGQVCSASPVPPPPPPAVHEGGLRVASRSPTGYRSGYPRRFTRSPNPSPPRVNPPRVSCVGASPATPGGTRVPAGPPPSSPVVEGFGNVEEVVQGLDEGESKDFRPGERTLWELPVLGVASEPNPAMRFSDWIHRVTPFFNDLAPRGHEWWQRVLQEARAEYGKWCRAKPLERSKLIGKPSQLLLSERFVRIEARGVAMLTKALPGALYEQALSCRSVTCTCLLFFTMRMFQPGGLTERSELLKGLTGLQPCDTAVSAVTVLQKWFRHLERARSMEISVPDSSLLLDAVDKCMKALLQANPSLQFRIHSVRMQLQLDTSPTLESVEEYTRNLLAEMELMVVSVPDGGNKRQRVAAVGQDSGDKGNGKGPKGGKTGEAGGQQGAGTGRGGKGDPVKLCSAWSTDAGCPNGKQCSLKHAPERPGGCWVCGGMHQKAECKAPGGGKASKDGDTGEDGGTKGKKGKPKGGEAKPPKTNVGQNPKGQPKGQASTTNVSEAAIREAAQILQSLRLASVKSDLQSATKILSKVGENGNRGLIDGGATSCMRTALPDEYNLPKIPVKLACGSCDMFINEHGTLLSQISVSPIISMKALLKLGYRMDWNATRCRVFHSKFGDLEVDTSSGCPEVDEGVALDLIREYELYVGRQDQRVARLQSIIADLRDRGTGELLELIRKGDAQADAAFSVYVSRLYPEASDGVLDQCIVSLQESLEENHTWNRRTRRRCSRAQGVVVHLFCGNARRAFENIAHRWDFAHLSVDVAEDLLCDSTYKFLLQQARDGRLRAVVGGPPCRTFSIARHLHETTGQGPRPIRLLGDSIGACGIKDLTCQEKAQRNTDDVMLLRFLTLMSFAVESNRAIGVPDPACLVENPCVEDELRKDGVEDGGYVSLWSTPEWKDLEKRTGMTTFRFFQSPLGHQKRRPTCIGSNLLPDAALVECSVSPEAVAYVPHREFGTRTERWCEWAPGFIQAVNSMLNQAFYQMRSIMMGSKVRKLDPGFIHHLKQNHMPYRSDCATCLRGSAKRKQHRRVLTPQSWCLSVDTAGPFAKGRDEHTPKAKYLVVGVLSVPVLAVEGLKVDEPADADPVPVPLEGGVFDDAEWLMDDASKVEEKDDDLTAKELSDARASWNEWDKLVKSSRDDWIQDAQSEVLPRVEIVDFVYVEAIERKSHQEVLTAIGRMHARAKAEGFDVRRLHSDRGREYNNKSLRDWCARHAVHKTLAVAEEHQGNGRAEGAIFRVKSKTRTILQEAGSSKADWPLAAKLAAHELKNTARRRLNIPVQESLPFDTRVQVVSRSWKRETWEARTIDAFVKCPSADMSRGWVVATEEGKLLTTGKLFPSIDHGKVSFTTLGAAVDLDAPDHRVSGKTSLKMLGYDKVAEPMHPADKLAQVLYKADRFQPKDLAELAVEVSKMSQQSERRINQPTAGADSKSMRTCNFLTGAFTHGGMTGVRTSTRDHQWVARYLTAYLSRYTDNLFAGVGLILNTEHGLHKDVHNLKGVSNVVLPVVTSGGGVWIQDRSLGQSHSEAVSRQVSEGKVVYGRNHTYRAHEAVCFQPDLWHESVQAKGQQLLLIGYTPRSLHKLSEADRQLLWETGFTLLPATRDEYWGYGSGSQVLTRFHSVPRKPLFSPSSKEWLPVPLSWFGDVRYCVQQFGAGSPVRSMHMWRQGRGKASGQMWTGTSSFKLRDPNCPDAVGEGVGHLEKNKNSEKSQEFLHMVSLEGQGPKSSHVESGRSPRLCALGLSDGASSVGGSEFPGGDLKVGDSRDLLAEKGIEICTSRCRKATVSEEFPSCCPRSVALKCWSFELRKLQKRLVDADEGRGSLEPEIGGPEGNSRHDVVSNFRVPPQVCGLEPCEPITQDDSEQFELYGVDWPMHADVSRAIDCLARQHHELRALLQGLEEGQEAATSRCDQLYWDALKGLERHGNELREVEDRLLKTACPAVLRSLSVAEEVNPEEFEEPVQERPSEPTLTDESDPPPLQTKIIGADQVRREPEKWIPSMTEEYHSLVSRTGAVQELSDGQYQQLLGDQGVTLEIIPGKLVYVHKPSGRRKSRIVGCGNYCQGGSSERNELYASGAGAESLRLMIRRCALQPDWVLGSVDVRTAFLQAPLLEQQRDGRRLVTIVRVPSILRETGVTTCRFWKVQKALYGLASAPRSWSNYRDKVLAGLRIPCEGGELRLSKMLEDANLLHIVKFPKESGGEDPTEGQRVGVIALYVDDVLIGAVRPICEAVIKALQDQWELSPPEWLATTGDQMKFAGYELQKTSEGIRLHQESYVQDLLEQNEDLIMGEERAPAVKMGVFEDTVDDAERRELTKRSQGLIGQLLWLAGRTRPDLAYAVSMAAQKIAASPREAVARAEHLVRYLRGAPGVSLHYKIADGNCGKWGQLRHQQTSTTLDVYTDASFAADEQCRSFGSVHLYWGGALVSWASARQTLIAAHTAESELYSLAEGHLMGKAFRPTVAALVNVSEHDLACHLYCDNAAAVQLCTLESGSWRTRHLRLRGAIIRQDLEGEVWALAHLEGVYMPADLGTKPVGPARLEDLLKVCDLWTPHLDVSKEPPRPSVAALSSGPSGFASTLLALLMLVQIHGAKAWEFRVEGSMCETLVLGFVLGFGIGSGMWFANSLGRVVCRLLLSSRSRCRSVAVSTEEAIISGQRVLQGPASSGHEARGSQEVGSPERLVSGDEEARPGEHESLQGMTYEDIRDMYYADLRSAYEHAEDIPEGLQYPVNYADVVALLGSPRAPTVPRPPGYPTEAGVLSEDDDPGPQPYLVVNRDEGVDSDLSEMSSDEDASTASGDLDRARDFGTGSSVRSQGSVSSGGASATRSVTAVTLAASVTGVQGRAQNFEDVSEGSVELWVVLGLVVCVSMVFGMLLTCACWKCWNRRVGAEALRESQGDREVQDQGKDCSDRVGSISLSPVVNVTIGSERLSLTPPEDEVGKGLRNRRFEVRAALAGESEASLGRGSLSVQQPKSPAEVRGLGPSPGASSQKHSKYPVGPCELGPSSSSAPSGKHSKTPVEPCEFGSSSGSASAGEHSKTPVGPCGLGPHPSSKSFAEQPKRPVELWGLGQDPPKAERPVSRLDARMRADEGLIGERSFQTGFRDSGSGFPVDKFPRPRGTRQNIILSCKADAAPPLVYLTQNGGCVHSGCECQPMRCSGAPIVRSLCRFCLEPGVLPSRKVEGSSADRVLYFTKSGRYMHGSRECSCLDKDEELDFRKLCRCCRW